MHLLKQSVAATVLVGPVLDAAGAAVTGALATTDFKITKNGTVVAMNTNNTVTHDHNGHYLIILSQTGTPDNNTVGRLAITMANVLYAMSKMHYEVLAATTFDAIVTNAAGAASGLPILDANASLFTSAVMQKIAREAYSVSGTVWHIATTGNDSNDGLSWTTAKLTVGAAITAAAGSADTFLIGAGSFSEHVTFAAGQTAIGAGRHVTIIGDATANAAVTVGSNCRLRDLDCVYTGGTTNVGLDASSTTDVVIEDCHCGGGIDGFLAGSAVRLTMRRVTASAKYDGGNTSGAKALYCEDCRFTTDCTYGGPGGERSGLLAANTSGAFMRCFFSASRNDSVAAHTSAVRMSSGNSVFVDCTLEAEQLGAGAGNVVGVNVTAGNAFFIGGNIILSSAGAGTLYDLSQAGGGTIKVSGLHYNTARLSGTITQLLPTIDASGNAYSDVKLIKTVDADTAISTRVDASTMASVVALNSTVAKAADLADVPTTAEIKTAMEAAGGHLALILEDTGTTLPAAIAAIPPEVGEGAYTGTLTVDDGATGLEGAVVNAYRGGVLIATGITDANGQITDWVFDAHTYDLAVRLPGYQPETDTVTVSGNAWTKTISLTAITITAPAAPTLCTAQLRLTLSDTAVAGAIFSARLLGINQAADGTILSNAEMSDTTDAFGIAELQLVRAGEIIKGDGLYAISVTINGKPVASVTTKIPNQSTILFADLL